MHPRLSLTLVAGALLAVFAVGCEKAKPGEPVTFDTVCDSKYDPPWKRA